MKYITKEITPRSMTCVIGACPAVFEVEEVEDKRLNIKEDKK